MIMGGRFCRCFPIFVATNFSRNLSVWIARLMARGVCSAISEVAMFLGPVPGWEIGLRFRFIISFLPFFVCSWLVVSLAVSPKICKKHFDLVPHSTWPFVFTRLVVCFTYQMRVSSVLSSCKTRQRQLFFRHFSLSCKDLCIFLIY